MSFKPRQTEFKVVLDGIDLDPKVEGRIRQAIQSAVLSEVSGLDLQGDERSPIFALLGDGQTQGIWIRMSDADVLQKTFPGFE